MRYVHSWALATPATVSMAQIQRTMRSRNLGSSFPNGMPRHGWLQRGRSEEMPRALNPNIGDGTHAMSSWIRDEIIT